MAEIRIPKDRIPADILHRLQAIGQSIIFPPQTASLSSTTTTTSATATISLQRAEGLPVSAQARYANGNHGNACLQSETHTPLPENLSYQTPRVMGTSDVFPASAEAYTVSTVVSSPPSSLTSSSLPTPKSSLSSFPSTSSSPPLLGQVASSPPGPRPCGEMKSSGFPGHHDLFSPHTGMTLVSSDCDETDGQPAKVSQESIVHVLDLNTHRKRGGHPVDESDIVRIFPMCGEGGQEEPDNIQSTAERPSEIVRVFPDEAQEPTSPQSKRLNSTPTKRMYSTPRKNIGSSSKSNKSSNNNNSNQHDSGNIICQGSSDPIAFSHQNARVQRSPKVPPLSSGSVVPSVLSEPPVFTLGESEPDEEYVTTHRGQRLTHLNSTPSKTRNTASTDTTPKHQRLDSLAKNSPGYGLTKSARLTPPVSAIARRSPGGLVTPPMTPDDMGEDEVFSYDSSREDSLPFFNRRSFDVYRQTIESTPRRDSPAPTNYSTPNQRRHSDLSIELRQLRHAQLNHHHAHSTGSAPPKSSPFSPAQRLSELSFGDRQQTRKRLSFEDCEEHKTPVHPSSASCSTIVHPNSTFMSTSSTSGDNFSQFHHHSEQKLAHAYQHQHQHPANTINHGDSNILETSHPPFRPQHLKPQTHRPRPSKSVSPSLKTRPGPSPFSASQSTESRAAVNASPRNHAHQQSSAPPPSPAQPIDERLMDPSMRGAVTSHHVVYNLRTPHRGRVHSEGDGLAQEVSNNLPGRPRGQTFSQAKRRRLETDEDATDGDQCGMQQQQQFQHEMHQHQQPRQHNYHLRQHHQYPSTSQQQRQQQSGPLQENPNTQLSPTCSCATIERDFLQVAEYAYKRIRCLDNTPGDFDRFRREMAQTNDILKEWLLIMGNIRTICCHAPSMSQQQLDAPPATSIQSTASKSLTTAFSSSPNASHAVTPMSVSTPLQPPFSSITAPSCSSDAFPANASLQQRHYLQHQQPPPCISSLSSSAQFSTLASRDFIDPSVPSDEIDDDDDDNEHDNFGDFESSSTAFDRQFFT